MSEFFTPPVASSNAWERKPLSGFLTASDLKPTGNITKAVMIGDATYVGTGAAEKTMTTIWERSLRYRPLLRGTCLPQSGQLADAVCQSDLSANRLDRKIPDSHRPGEGPRRKRQLMHFDALKKIMLTVQCSASPELLRALLSVLRISWPPQAKFPILHGSAPGLFIF